MREIRLSADAKAKITRGDFAEKQVRATTEELIVAMGNWPQRKSLQAALKDFEHYIQHGADLKCVYRKDSTILDDFVYEFIGQRNVKALEALLILGVASPSEGLAFGVLSRWMGRVWVLLETRNQISGIRGLQDE